MSGSMPSLLKGLRASSAARPVARPGRLLTLIAPLATPWIAGTVALLIYLLRVALSPQGFGASPYAYFNYLADAFLHGQLFLRVQPSQPLDLVFYNDRTYLYWPPLPALLSLPMVALFGIGASDVLLSVIIGALTIGLLANVLAALDRAGVATLDRARRAALVATCAFGTFLLFLIPTGRVWYLAQVIGWGCILLATLAALRGRGTADYFLVGLALAAALATRMPLVLNGLWLAPYLLRRDWSRSWGWRIRASIAGLAPLAITLLALGWYNWARFGDPLQTGLAWQHVGGPWRDDLARWGQMNLHYLPTNLYYHFISYPLNPETRYNGGGLFWLTPLFLGAFAGLWRARRDPFTWILVASCVIIYLPSGVLNGTGWVSVGPRYLLDLLVPLLILTALGIRRWRPTTIQVLTLISIATYAIGSLMWWYEYQV